MVYERPGPDSATEDDLSWLLGLKEATDRADLLGHGPYFGTETERALRERGAKFKDVVNDAILAALGPKASEAPFVQRTFDLGWSLTTQQMKELDEQEEIEEHERLARGPGEQQ